MKILFVSSECYPFAKAGGLADAVSSLAIALSRRGHDVRLLMPRYYFNDRNALDRTDARISVPIGNTIEPVSLFQTEYHGVTVYFLENEGLYGRDGIYGDTPASSFPDNARRFAVLSKAAWLLPEAIGWKPEILHGHDWPAGLLPVYGHLLVEENARDSRNAVSTGLSHQPQSPVDSHDQSRKDRVSETSLTVVFTIHNLGYQGPFAQWDLPLIGLTPTQAQQFNLIRDNQLNFLNAGIAESDVVTTVSPSYAREILTKEHGFGLDDTLRARTSAPKGILNGIDLDDWNPSSDPHIPAPFSASNLKGKRLCKQDLQQQMGLPEDPDVPLVGMVTRLVEQKGISELFDPKSGSARRILKELPLQLAIVGSGAEWCESEVRNLSSRFPNLAAVVGYDNKLAHLIEAGADFFLMPSRYEPCGLNQMYSMRYGTVPIVTKTGGLADTVAPNTGFLIGSLTADAVFSAVETAVRTYNTDRKTIRRMQQAGMNMDFGWDRSAAEYEEVYRSATT